MSQTISSFLSKHLSASKAIGALNKEWLTYGALRELTQKVKTMDLPWLALLPQLLNVQLLRR